MRYMQAIQSYEECSRLCPTSVNAFQNRLLALNYIYPGESQFVCDAHAQWGAAHDATVTRLPAIDPAEWPTAADGRLRVGYVSPDLHRHSVSYFAEAPLLLHNRDQIEVRRQRFSLLPAKLMATRGVREVIRKTSNAFLAADESLCMCHSRKCCSSSHSLSSACMVTLTLLHWASSMYCYHQPSFYALCLCTQVADIGLPS
jgi:hypothetical protein